MTIRNIAKLVGRYTGVRPYMNIDHHNQAVCPVYNVNHDDVTKISFLMMVSEKNGESFHDRFSAWTWNWKHKTHTIYIYIYTRSGKWPRLRPRSSYFSPTYRFVAFTMVGAREEKTTMLATLIAAWLLSHEDSSFRSYWINWLKICSEANNNVIVLRVHSPHWRLRTLIISKIHRKHQLFQEMIYLCDWRTVEYIHQMRNPSLKKAIVVWREGG